jgi:hypothetical protein
VAEQAIPVGRIVVIAEMADGTVRALDGIGSGLINVETHFDERWLDGPVHPIGRTTTVTLTYPGNWTMYTSRHPDMHQQNQIEPSTKELENG